MKTVKHSYVTRGADFHIYCYYLLRHFALIPIEWCTWSAVLLARVVAAKAHMKPTNKYDIDRAPTVTRSETECSFCSADKQSI